MQPEAIAKSHDVPCAALQVVQNKVENLEDWQARQNGHLRDISEKLDKLLFWVIAALGTTAMAVALALANQMGKPHP